MTKNKKMDILQKIQDEVANLRLQIDRLPEEVANNSHILTPGTAAELLEKYANIAKKIKELEEILETNV